MSQMIQVVVDSIRVNLMGPQRLVILREIEGDRYLPIWVGPFEAEAIAVPLREIEIGRPLTHDLLKNLFRLFSAPVQRVEINALRDEIFYAQIVALHEGKEITLDARPSDAIALALRVAVPIMVSAEVFEQASFRMDEPLGASQPPAGEAESQDADDRLSVFEDFLENLDVDDDEEDE